MGRRAAGGRCSFQGQQPALGTQGAAAFTALSPYPRAHAWNGASGVDLARAGHGGGAGAAWGGALLLERLTRQPRSCPECSRTGT